MPEEFRIWKEKIDTIEKKKMLALQQQQQQQQQVGFGYPPGMTEVTVVAGGPAPQPPYPRDAPPSAAKGASNGSATAASGTAGGFSAAGGGANKQAVAVVPPVVYATHEAAVEAFKELLAAKRVSITAKVKEMQDLCADDPRWDALKSMGDKKQALAEYQVSICLLRGKRIPSSWFCNTALDLLHHHLIVCDAEYFCVVPVVFLILLQTKRLKEEKEQQKIKARKHRDAFLLMLAENTSIDARTRWRDAIEILQPDARFKNVESMTEKEDLFQDFINELEKKEREDRRKIKAVASAAFTEILAKYYEDGKFAVGDVWGDVSHLFTSTIVSTEFKAMDEGDFRFCYREFMNAAEEKKRKAERERRDAAQKTVTSCETAFRALLDRRAALGKLAPGSKWKDISAQPAVVGSEEMKALMVAYLELRRSDAARSSSSTTTSYTEADKTEAFTQCKYVFESVMKSVEESYNKDRRTIRDALKEMHSFKLVYSTTLAEFLSALLLFARLKEQRDASGLVVSYLPLELSGTSASSDSSVVLESSSSNSSSAAASSSIGAVVSGSTDGTQPVPAIRSDASNRSGEAAASAVVALEGLPGAVRSLLMQRASHAALAFDDMLALAIEDHEEEQRSRRKAEARFTDLLDELFYKTEHLAMSWDEAKKKLQRRSAYDAVGHSERKVLYAAHMDSLAKKLGIPIEKSAKINKTETKPSAHSSNTSVTEEISSLSRMAASSSGRAIEGEAATTTSSSAAVARVGLTKKAASVSSDESSGGGGDDDDDSDTSGDDVRDKDGKKGSSSSYKRDNGDSGGGSSRRDAKKRSKKDKDRERKHSKRVNI
jgi:hypothetical protein